MNNSYTLGLFALAFVAAVVVAKAGGVNHESLLAFSFAALLMGIPWYFYSRRAKAPSRFEVAAAFTWLLVRRLVGFTGALLFVYVALLTAISAVELSSMARLGDGLLMLVMAALCGWVAVFGQGRRRADWRDDIELHEENKKRYRWRW